MWWAFYLFSVAVRAAAATPTSGTRASQRATGSPSQTSAPVRRTRHDVAHAVLPARLTRACARMLPAVKQRGAQLDICGPRLPGGALLPAAGVARRD